MGIFEQEKGMSTSDRTVLARWKEEATYEGGHYTLPIPFRKPQPRLPDNLEMAKKPQATTRTEAACPVHSRDAGSREQRISSTSPRRGGR